VRRGHAPPQSLAIKPARLPVRRHPPDNDHPCDQQALLAIERASSQPSNIGRLKSQTGRIGSAGVRELRVAQLGVARRWAVAVPGSRIRLVSKNVVGRGTRPEGKVVHDRGRCSEHHTGLADDSVPSAHGVPRRPLTRGACSEAQVPHAIDADSQVIGLRRFGSPKTARARSQHPRRTDQLSRRSQRTPFGRAPHNRFLRSATQPVNV
jgi:hypothetical protein